MHQERPRSAGWVENADLRQCSAKRVAIRPRQRLTVARRVHDRRRNIQRLERGVEPFAANAFDDRPGSVERARCTAIAGGHERFERAAEHFRIDCRFGPRRRALVCGDTISREQAADEFAECLVGKAQIAGAPLERRSSEETAVEERDASERTRRGGAPADRRVECPEEERIEQMAVHFAVSRAAGVEGVPEELAVAVEPSFRFEEREEEDARRAEQGELTSRLDGRAPSCRRRERAHQPLEFAIEPSRERVAPEQLAPAMVHEHVDAARCVRHCGERLAVGVGHMLDIDREGRDARARSRRGRRDHERVRRRLHHDEEPEQLRSLRRYPSRDARDRLPNGYIRRGLEQQCAQRSWAVRHGGPPDRTIEPDRPPRIEIERQRFGESERREERREIAKGSGAGEKSGRIAERRHAARCRCTCAEPSPPRRMPHRKYAAGWVLKKNHGNCRINHLIVADKLWGNCNCSCCCSP